MYNLLIRLKFCLWWWFMNDMNIFSCTIFCSLFAEFMKSTWNTEEEKSNTRIAAKKKHSRNEERATIETAKSRIRRRKNTTYELEYGGANAECIFVVENKRKCRYYWYLSFRTDSMGICNSQRNQCITIEIGKTHQRRRWRRRWRRRQHTHFSVYRK